MSSSAKPSPGGATGYFLVSKVLPNHATRRGTIIACAASLRRLATDRLDRAFPARRKPVPLEMI